MSMTEEEIEETKSSYDMEKDFSVITPVELDEIWEACGVKSPKQQGFITAYFYSGMDVGKAVYMAGYNSKDYKSAGHLGRQMMKRPYIKKAMNMLSEKMGTRTSIKPDYVIKKIVRGVEQADHQGKLAEMFKGLDMLAKYLGMYTEKIEVTGKDGEAIKLEQRIKDDVQSFASTIASLASRAGERNGAGETLQ